MCFRVKDALTGRDNAMSSDHKINIGKDYKYFYAPCFSLNTMLKALDIKKVDFFSLDLEGGEYDVLSNINFEKIDITSLVIEINDKKRLKSVMDKKENYKLLLEYHDLYYLKK